LTNHPKWIVLSIPIIVISKNGKLWQTNKMAKSCPFFWKAGNFGNICQIWHHLATPVVGLNSQLECDKGEHLTGFSGGSNAKRF